MASRLPSLDDIVVQILGLLGVSGTIIALVAAGFAVQSWYDGAMLTITFTRKARRGLGAARTALTGMTPIRGVAAVFITLTVPIAQLLTVGLCFLGGNYVSMIFHRERWERAVAVIKADPEHFYHPERFSQFLSLDAFSIVYVLLAIVILLYSYTLTDDPTDDLFGIGVLLAGPASILLLVARGALLICLALLLLMVLLALVAPDLDPMNELRNGLSILMPLLIGVSVCLVYFLACQAAVRASRLVVRVWTR